MELENRGAPLLLLRWLEFYLEMYMFQSYQQCGHCTWINTVSLAHAANCHCAQCLFMAVIIMSFTIMPTKCLPICLKNRLNMHTYRCLLGRTVFKHVSYSMKMAELCDDNDAFRSSFNLKQELFIFCSYNFFSVFPFHSQMAVFCERLNLIQTNKGMKCIQKSMLRWTYTLRRRLSRANATVALFSVSFSLSIFLYSPSACSLHVNKNCKNI